MFLLPGEDAEALGATLAVVPGTSIWAPKLPQRADGTCAYLGDAGCTIYERRPRVCAGFDCRAHYYKPAAQRRALEAVFGPRDKAIARRGRELVEKAK